MIKTEKNSTYNITSIIFAAGKSNRFKSYQTKMLEDIDVCGIKKPMLFHTIDLLFNFSNDIIILIGVDGTEIKKAINSKYNEKVKFLRVSDDDGSNLEPNTSGTLKKYGIKIIEEARYTTLLFCVGDQPFMTVDSIDTFIMSHFENKKDISLLVVDSKGTALERSTSTRVILSENQEIMLKTPQEKENITNYSTIVDVGVLIISTHTFLTSFPQVNENSAFSNLILCMPTPKKVFIAITTLLNSKT